mgnify:FL=1
MPMHIPKNRIDFLSLNFSLCLFMILFGCNDGSKNNIEDSTLAIVKGKSKNKDSNTQIGKASIDTSKYSSIDYLKGITELEISIGNLQGISKSDSVGPYVMADCNDCNETYELLLVPIEDFDKRKRFTVNDLKKRFFSDPSYKEFQCYAFVIPMLSSEQQIDIHLDNNKYPSDVKVFKRDENNRWVLLTTRKVNSLSDLSRLQLDCIFNKE